LKLNGIQKGNGYLEAEQIVQKPFDFATKTIIL